MDRPPVPPTALLDAPRSEGADANCRSGSAYRGLDARETSAKYLKQLRSISVQLIVVLLANLVVMLWAVRLERYVLYLVALTLTLVAAFVTRLRKVKLFTGLSEVVGEDCDPARYRAALDVLAERDRFGRSANTIAIELAYCDYLELDSAGTLRRLESVGFKRASNPWWFRAMQVEFMARLDMGDLEGARDALARLSAFRKNFKEGSRNRVLADAQVDDYAVLLRPPAERDAADAARMRERMAAADCHQQRANWQLYFAEYELLHGSPDEAARLASDPALEPLTPRMERLRAEVLSGLEVSG